MSLENLDTIHKVLEVGDADVVPVIHGVLYAAYGKRSLTPSGEDVSISLEDVRSVSSFAPENLPELFSRLAEMVMPRS